MAKRTVVKKTESQLDQSEGDKANLVALWCAIIIAWAVAIAGTVISVGGGQ